MTNLSNETMSRSCKTQEQERMMSHDRTAVSFRRQKKFVFLFLILLLISLCMVLNLSDQNKNYLGRFTNIEEQTYYENKTTTTTMEKGNEGETIDSFKAVIWPKLKEKLCPDMRPNIMIGSKLFSIAQKELGLKENARALTIQDYSFGWTGGSIYQPQDNTKPPFVYINVWKAAHNQINYWLQDELANKTNGTYTEYPYIAQINRQMQSQPNKPCIVTAIRDPISHFLSGYNEIEDRLMDNPQRIPTRINPLFFTRFENGTKNRFIQFVTDYITGRKETGMDDVNLELGHIFMMSGILHHIRLTSYLPTIANLSTAWPQFLADTCGESLPNEVYSSKMKIMGQHDSQKDCYGFYAAAKDVWNDQGPIARALCVIHAIDYACWDQLPDGIPRICQDVYSSQEDFINGLKKGRPRMNRDIG